jgi:hypothetical protein
LRLPRHGGGTRFPPNFAKSAGKTATINEAKPWGGRGSVEGTEAAPAVAKARLLEDRVRPDALLSLALFLRSRQVPRV